MAAVMQIFLQLTLILGADDNGHPSVVVIPKSAAQESGDFYYLIGKLEGLIWHKAYENTTEYVNGHVWTASFDKTDLPQKINQSSLIHPSVRLGTWLLKTMMQVIRSLLMMESYLFQRNILRVTHQILANFYLYINRLPYIKDK